jgi:hypothetical protein
MKKIFVILGLFIVGSLYANPLLKIQTDESWNKTNETAEETVWSKNNVTMTKVSKLNDYHIELSDNLYTIKFECNKNNIQSIESDLLNGVIPNVDYTITRLKSQTLKKRTISKSSNVKISDGTREGVATASTRASEAKEDFEWDE